MWETVAKVAVPLIGGMMSSSANSAGARAAMEAQRYAADVAANAQREAANLIAQGQHEAAKIYVEATNRQLEMLERAIVEVSAGNMAALETLRDMRIDTAPAMVAMREMTQNAGRLTPEQQYQLEQLRASTSNAIGSSGFAGSGRTAAALFRQVETDFVNRAMEANRDRSFQATSQLAGQFMQSGNQIAGVQANQGAQVAGLVQDGARVVQQGAGAIAGTQTNAASAQAAAVGNVGQIQANSAINQGATAGNLATANAEVWGKTLGDVGSVIANQQRESKYQGRMQAFEKTLAGGM